MFRGRQVIPRGLGKSSDILARLGLHRPVYPPPPMQGRESHMRIQRLGDHRIDVNLHGLVLPRPLLLDDLVLPDRHCYQRILGLGQLGP